MGRENIDRVAEFHRAFDNHISDEPALPALDDGARRELLTVAMNVSNMAERCLQLSNERDQDAPDPFLRLHLLLEEVGELAGAVAEGNLVEVLDALVDIRYVLDGAVLTLGFQDYIEAGMLEVHRANMAKLGPDGKPILEAGGRVRKPDGWPPPNMKRVLESGGTPDCGACERPDFCKFLVACREGK